MGQFRCAVIRKHFKSEIPPTLRQVNLTVHWPHAKWTALMLVAKEKLTKQTATSRTLCYYRSVLYNYREVLFINVEVAQSEKRQLRKRKRRRASVQ